MTKEQADLEKKYPSVDLAYPLALASYDVAQKRLEVVEKRLQEILGFAVTISLGVVVLHANKNYSFKSYLFMLAMLACLSGLAIGTYARVEGHLILIKPSVLLEKYIDLPESTFKRYFVYFAAQHWQANASLVNRKGKFTSVTVVCFIMEIILLIVWSLGTGQS